MPSVLAGVGLGALLLAVSTQAQMRRAIEAILLLLVIATTIVATVPLLVSKSCRREPVGPRRQPRLTPVGR